MGADGNPFYSNKDSESKLLKPKRILEDADQTSCEFLVRPGFALSYAAAVLREGFTAARKFVPLVPPDAEVDVMTEDQAKAALKDCRAKLDQSGLAAVRAWI